MNALVQFSYLKLHSFLQWIGRKYLKKRGKRLGIFCGFFPISAEKQNNWKIFFFLSGRNAAPVANRPLLVVSILYTSLLTKNVGFFPLTEKYVLS